MPSRSDAFVCAISRMNIATSKAAAALVSPRKSMSRCTTAPAVSGNLIAHACTACTSIWRYSPAFSPASVCDLAISFFSAPTTSSMLRAVTRSSTMSKALRRMSLLGEFTARRMSITISCIT